MPTDTAERAAVAEIDRLLGDPADPDAELLAADEQSVYFATGQQLLERYRVGAQLVPPALGGRLAGPAGLVDVLRAIARRDLALCLGGTAGSAAAALTVWTCGTDAQRRAVADALLDNGVVAGSARLVEPGGLRLHGSGGGLVLDGPSADLADAATARLLLLSARSAGTGGGRLILADPQRLPDERLRRCTTARTVGLRGVPFAGVDLDECPVPAGSVLPDDGGGVRPVEYAALVARLLRPAVAIGTLDSALRIAVCYAAGRRLNGRPVADLSYPRRILVEAFADLLLCDCLTSAGIRALARSPGAAGRYAAAVDALVPRWLGAAVHRLSTLMGATFYLREGPFAVFQKHLRDLNQAVLGTTDERGRRTALLAELSRDGGLELDGRMLAARACVETWVADRGTGLSGDVEWLRVVLDRLGYRPRTDAPDPLDPLWTELVRRYEQGRTFDIAGRPLPHRAVDRHHATSGR
jgi:alkylation response protein AidB-like acyl-CoA dehydrogenase